MNPTEVLNNNSKQQQGSYDCSQKFYKVLIMLDFGGLGNQGYNNAGYGMNMSQGYGNYGNNQFGGMGMSQTGNASPFGGNNNFGNNGFGGGFGYGNNLQ